MPARKWDKLNPAKIADLLKTKTMFQVAKEFGVSSPTIRRILDEHGIPVPKHKKTWWKGRVKQKRIVDSQGYAWVICEGHPKSNPKVYMGRVAEHRLMVERKIGRLLRRDEHVHHKNGNRSDNRIENLVLMSASSHRGYHNKFLADMPGVRAKMSATKKLSLRKYPEWLPCLMSQDGMNARGIASVLKMSHTGIRGMFADEGYSPPNCRGRMQSAAQIQKAQELAAKWSKIVQSIPDVQELRRSSLHWKKRICNMAGIPLQKDGKPST